MQAWLESIAGPEFAPALMWTVVALVALLILLVVVRIVRGLTFGTFVAGGRNRKARLAVMDAAAVDSQRRLVLVRRDDVEHLILIGGPTDVVVEQNIRLLAPATARRPAEEEIVHSIARQQQEAPVSAPRPHDSPAPRPAASVAQPPHARPVAPQRPVAPTVPQPVEPRVAAPAVSPAPAVSSTPPVYSQPAYAPSTARPVTPPAAPVYPAAPAVSVRQPVTMPVAPPPAPAQTVTVSAPQRAQDLDSALLEELQVSLQNDHTPSTAKVDLSLDEEMSKLLSDLSEEKRR